MRQLTFVVAVGSGPAAARILARGPFAVRSARELNGLVVFKVLSAGWGRADGKGRAMRVSPTDRQVFGVVRYGNARTSK